MAQSFDGTLHSECAEILRKRRPGFMKYRIDPTVEEIVKDMSDAWLEDGANIALKNIKIDTYENHNGGYSSKLSLYAGSSPVTNKNNVTGLDIKDCPVKPGSTFEELVGTLYEMSEKKATVDMTEEELEKETCYQLAEEGMLNLTKAEIDLAFLKRKQPIPPPLRIVKEDINIFNGISRKFFVGLLMLVFGMLLSGVCLFHINQIEGYHDTFEYSNLLCLLRVLLFACIGVSGWGMIKLLKVSE